jgi:aminopeptidase
MTTSFETNLQKYAELVIKVGVNVQPGQNVLLRLPVDAAALGRHLLAEAYKAGAHYVNVFYNDEMMQLLRFEHAPRDSFDYFPDWMAEAMLSFAKNGDAIISVYAANPDLLKNQDPELIGAAHKASAQKLRPFSEILGADLVPWTVVSASTPSWANKVFAHLPEPERVPALWDAIFKICRVDKADPVAAWREHTEKLVKRSAYLNERQYVALKYDAPGTDLVVGLPENHVWMGGYGKTQSGTPFTANIPTEEVFTLPHKDRINGTVRATLPLSLRGTLVQDFWMRFEDGKVVEVHAKTGEAMLKKLLETDAGASMLGEVALVPQSSPIAQSGILFYNTLYDENASCHLAVGRAYRTSLQGGETMSEAAFGAAGGNDSLIHVDFMIGADEMNIDGILADGSTEPVFRQGEWAFEV